jgi:hypothetical protein
VAGRIRQFTVRLPHEKWGIQQLPLKIRRQLMHTPFVLAKPLRAAQRRVVNPR